VKTATVMSAPERDFSIYRESPAMTLLELKAACASQVFMFAPPGQRLVCPSGAKQSLFVNVTEGLARMLSSQIAAMRAAGRETFIDVNHSGVKAGRLLDVFWRQQSGILGIAEWLPAAEAGIIAGELTNFSPQWVALSGEVVGIGQNCGALLTRSVEPAYGKHLCRVTSVTRQKQLTEFADLFVHRVDRRAMELRAQGDELATLHSHDQVRAAWPQLYAAHSLRESLMRDLGIDFQLRTA